MAKEFIVAIELGSTNIIGVAGKKNIDGSISILSVIKEDSTSCINKGVVYNIDKTVQCLTNIIKRLETSLKAKVAQVYVGVGGQSIRSVKNTLIKELPLDTVVTLDMVNELMDENRNMTYPAQEVLDAITQEYKVDAQYQLDPVGIQCTRLEANLLNILWKKSFYRNLNKCFDNAGIAIAEMYLAPLALADSVLTDVEKRVGCVLVDLGAETTTVSVYYRNILRHLAVIPLGGNNITIDIASLQMDDENAEKMKRKYASAYTDSKDIDENLKYSIDEDRQVDSKTFIEIVEARLEEIIKNVWYQVPSEYTDKLLGGFIITGGVSNMKNIEKAFKQHTGVDKIRIANFVQETINSNIPEITAHDATMNTVLGLIAKGDMNCAGDELTSDLFAKENNTEATSTLVEAPKAPRSITETQGRGVVPTEAEKQKAEEEARRKREEEEAEQRAREEEERRLEEEKRKNSPLNKLFRKTKNFFEQIMKEEGE
ncbi:cell division protein FtsA [Hoylesella nanceiensis]|jgi:cell division protein ftsA|uniref:cell division protein FtsA n=1 Tax=Hoylesella nanceiensis TaxID=425941 RepID=UPI001C5DB770|nr:cell division protein FtsA [Hoylesella nanceiensis]MBF1426311.1 cell division protein FtsA [Hoylesella nanceiensis]MBF1428738.1 cell division protein FtsA [Hoylesella nanceiensis]MBF1432486.1 cell division protein FtsA [Hoylesella nanceiensis]MBW4834378.1 cell division protein FtsA [Hoylesella nanceiensis]